jgi:hypothetical protein
VLKMPQGIVQLLCSPAHLSMLQRRDIASFLSDVRRWSLSDEDPLLAPRHRGPRAGHAARLRGRQPAARMEQFKGFHSVVEGLAREARRIEQGRRA